MVKILAVDDKEDNLITLSAILRDLIPECSVITAQSGLEGIEKVKTESPDTILLDIKMPGMDGYEVCKRLKEDTETRHIPVILISALLTDSSDYIKGLDIGADAYLAKPIDERVLTAHVKTALRMKNAEDTLRRQKDLQEELVRQRTAELTDSNIKLRCEIDERKRIEDALRESEERLQSIIDEATAVIYIKDTQYKYILINRRFEKLSRVTKDMIIGKTDFDIVADKIAIIIRENDRKVLDLGRALEFEEIIIQDDGPHTYISIKFPISDASGFIYGICCISTDITERKKLEAQLQQAQKMESIGTLAGGIAHDFNNILFSVLGNTEMLLEDIPGDNPMHDNLNAIFNGALRARDLVKQILTFSRQDNNESKQLRIQSVVKETLKLVRSTIPNSIEIKHDISNDCGIIKADPTQIHQIVMNLATNSYHAMEDTGGELKVGLKEIELGEQEVIDLEMQSGRYAFLSIADTGMGIDKDVRQKIFDPFFTTKEQGKGTGMGLSVVHGIVKNAGGGIRVLSEPGEGTEFQIYLPVITNPSEQFETQAIEPIPMGTERILLVDDENAITTIEKQIIERLGYQVDSHTSSLEALEAFRKDSAEFDMVITDMGMPNMSGSELASELVKIRQDIPILLCTGFSEKIHEEKLAAIGIKDFLMKPIVTKDLAKKIRDVLDNP